MKSSRYVEAKMRTVRYGCTLWRGNLAIPSPVPLFARGVDWKRLARNIALMIARLQGPHFMTLQSRSINPAISPRRALPTLCRKFPGRRRTGS